MRQGPTAASSLLTDTRSLPSQPSPATCVPRRLTPFECHLCAPGTALGDPTEVAGLGRALRKVGLCLRSVRPNIGHTEPVGGLVGLIALIRRMQQQTAHVNAAVRTLNPLLAAPTAELDGYVNVQNMPFTGIVEGVSSFAYTGTIAHAILGARPAHEGLHAAPPPALLYRRQMYRWQVDVQMVAQVVQELTHSSQRPQPTTSLMDAGVESLVVSEFVETLQERTGVRLDATMVFEAGTAETLAEHLVFKLGLKRSAAPPALQAMPVARPLGEATLAVDGTTGRWPGGPSAEHHVLATACGDAVGPVPAERWSLEEEVTGP